MCVYVGSILWVCVWAERGKVSGKLGMFAFDSNLSDKFWVDWAERKNCSICLCAIESFIRLNRSSRDLKSKFEFDRFM